MKKLFNLKKFLTLSETARHLSTIVEEDVKEADILRLALDGQLKLSVYFANATYARCGDIVSEEEIEWFDPTENHIRIVSDIQKAPQRYCKDWVMLNDERILKFHSTIVRPNEVWNLPMIGEEILEVKRQYQSLIGGSAITDCCLDGAFIENEKGLICQLVRPMFRDPKMHVKDFCPADGLPQDSMLVVRPSALRALEQTLSQEEVDQSGPKPQTIAPQPHRGQILEENEYWNVFKNKALNAIEKFPAWKKKQYKERPSAQKKVQLTGNLIAWLNEDKDIAAEKTREAEVLKKVLLSRFSSLY